MSTLRNKFNNDKQNLLTQVSEHIKKLPQTLEPQPGYYRVQAHEFVSMASQLKDKAQITEAMKCFEAARDARCGITLHEIIINNTPILIRDARAAFPRIIRGSEAYEIQYLNIMRAALDIADIEERPDLTEKIFAELKNFSKKFLEVTFSVNLDQRIKEEKVFAKKLQSEIDEIASIFTKNGVTNALAKLSVAKDFQNLENKNYNIATISKVENNTVAECEVALRELTDEQKMQYQNMLLTPWFQALPWWQKKLCEKYAPQILSSAHVIPTQLWQIPGLRNAFEKITAIVNDDEIKIVHEVKHSGTPASFASDKGSRQEIADENLEQLREWIAEGSVPHINSLNTTGIMARSHDGEIVDQLKQLNTRHTNTALNLARFSSSSSITHGANQLLAAVSATIAKFPKAAVICDNLEPSGGLFRTTRRFISNIFNGPKSAVKKLQNTGDITDEDAKILLGALSLRKSVDEMNSFIVRPASGNASLRTSTKLAWLTRLMRDCNSELKWPKEEIIVTCKHGKDRTGLAMHDQSAQALAFALGINVKKVDRALICSGHTAQQAGGVYSCGSTAGCYGIRHDNALNMGFTPIAATRTLFSRLKHARIGREKHFVDLIEYAAHGTLSRIGKLEEETRKYFSKDSKSIRLLTPLKAEQLQQNNSQEITL